MRTRFDRNERHRPHNAHKQGQYHESSTTVTVPELTTVKRNSSCSGRGRARASNTSVWPLYTLSWARLCVSCRNRRPVTDWKRPPLPLLLPLPPSASPSAAGGSCNEARVASSSVATKASFSCCSTPSHKKGETKSSFSCCSPSSTCPPPRLPHAPTHKVKR